MGDFTDGMNSNDTKKPDNWKNQLSPAFNEEEIFLSLILLAIFYVIYAIVKASFDAHDNSASDEERFIRSCFCSVNQRSFYRIWFSLCCLIWLCIHTYSFFTQLFIQRYPRFRNPLKLFLAFGMLCLETVCCCICQKLCKYKSTANFDIRKINDQELVSKIKSNYALLWFQYCKLYVVGYTGYDAKILPIKKSETHNEDSPNKKKGCCILECSVQKSKIKSWHLCSMKKECNNALCCCCFERSKESHRITHQKKYNCVCCGKHYNIWSCSTSMICCDEYYPSICSLKSIVRGTLFIVKYFSQLATVPLLFLQVFDTYSFLCFSPDSFCSHTTENNLHLFQTTITLLFYCCLVGAHLTGTLLLWNLWPEANKNTKAHL